MKRLPSFSKAGRFLTELTSFIGHLQVLICVLVIMTIGSWILIRFAFEHLYA